MKHILKSNGEKTSSGGLVVYLDGEYLSPKHSQGIFNHSSDGFAIGYNGSGPSQLALAVLLKICDKGIAVSQYKQFREEVIAKLDKNSGFKIEIEWPEVFTEDKHTEKDMHPAHPDDK